MGAYLLAAAAVSTSAAMGAWLLGFIIMTLLNLNGIVTGTDLRREVLMPWRWGWNMSRTPLTPATICRR
jgi:hypothetical protein